MKNRNKWIGMGILILTTCVGTSLAGVKTWKNNTSGDWFEADNWNEGAVPVAGDDVEITNTGAKVILSGSTPLLNSVTVSETLTFTNWNSALNATGVTILNKGKLTLPGAFTNDAMAHNIYVVCSNLVIETGGSINADGKGFAGGRDGWADNGYGPGGGKTKPLLYAGGGGYGGVGGDFVPNWNNLEDRRGGPTYGSSSMPTHAGSGGGRHSRDATWFGGDGGGAIRIDASGSVTVNGTISANGSDGFAYGGGGSGGSVYVTCRKLLGSNGIIRANGGHAGLKECGGGGGGRVSVVYHPVSQSEEPLPAVAFSVKCGFVKSSAAKDYPGDIGTLYFPDSRFLTENITHVGQWMAPGITSWSVNNLTFNDGWLRFSADGFELTVTNDLTITGSSGALELGSVLITNMFRYSISTGAPVLNVGGNLTLTNSGSLYLYAGLTDGSEEAYGGTVSVGKDLLVASDSWIYPYSQLTNGGSVRFQMRNLSISTNGGFNANGAGFAGARDVWQMDGYGPGGGNGYGYAGGGGYGGAGGDAERGEGGLAYGSSNKPLQPGSGGGKHSDLEGGSECGGSGGGLVWIEASGSVTLDGTLKANGGNGTDRCAGGSGGGVYVTCNNLFGTHGIISANGGTTLRHGGGGGGGRIAVWRMYDKTLGTIQTTVTPGPAPTHVGDAGTVGTIVWGQIPPPGTMILVF